ncbi:MAG: hypothetical protein IT330_17335 [Anaerolineae bacterium]|nr:hypothetical protein [Anaerolineae bacterium]
MSTLARRLARLEQKHTGNLDALWQQWMDANKGMEQPQRRRRIWKAMRRLTLADDQLQTYLKQEEEGTLSDMGFCPHWFEGHVVDRDEPPPFPQCWWDTSWWASGTPMEEAPEGDG